MRFAVAVACVAVAGCAAAMPLGTFGSTTPHYRTDVAAGASVRIARGDVRAASNEDPAQASERAVVDATGIVPVAAARYGVGEHLDLGVVASGTGLRFDLRGETVVREGSTRVAVVYGVGPSYTFLRAPRGEEGGGHLVALEPMVALGVDLGGLYEAWVGPRLVLGGLFGEFEDASGALARSRGFRLDVGGTLGLAAGFRRVHAFLEFSALYERNWGDRDGTSLSRGGFVMIPAFGLRVRI